MPRRGEQWSILKCSLWLSLHPCGRVSRRGRGKLHLSDLLPGEWRRSGALRWLHRHQNDVYLHHREHTQKWRQVQPPQPCASRFRAADLDIDAM